MSNPSNPCAIRRFDGQTFESTFDHLAAEEPLEVVLSFGEKTDRIRRPLAVTMRTPGADRELAAGFLFTEKIVGAAADILSARLLNENSLLVELRPGLAFDAARLERHFYTTSSCGVCGKGSLELVDISPDHFPMPGRPRLSPTLLTGLPEKLRAAQDLFAATGGIHAAALFDENGDLLSLHEDVGRHNALDKLLGAALLSGKIPLREHVVVVSGRAGFELVQKAAMAGVPVLAAVGAPSSLAVELARAHGMTLVGFLREGRFNVYAGEERVVC